MKVFNQSKKITLADNLKNADSFSDKLLGLLRKSNIGCSMLFRTRFGIHTFFLKRPIDVIVLDRATSRCTSGRSCNFSQTRNYKNLNVVKVATVKPNKFFFWNPKYSLVIEMPRETIKKTKTEIGDTILLS